VLPWQGRDIIRDFRSKNEADKLKHRGSLEYKVPYLPTTCYFVRHGESLDNASFDNFCGISNPPLTENGFHQADLTGCCLIDAKIEKIFTSPLKRAHDTARHIKSKAGGTLIIDEI